MSHVERKLQQPICLPVGGQRAGWGHSSLWDVSQERRGEWG